jgi:hypothetical protein
MPFPRQHPKDRPKEGEGAYSQLELLERIVLVARALTVFVLAPGLFFSASSCLSDIFPLARAGHAYQLQEKIGKG